MAAPSFVAAVGQTGVLNDTLTATLGTTQAGDLLLRVVKQPEDDPQPSYSGTYSGGSWTSIGTVVVRSTSGFTTEMYLWLYYSVCSGNHSGQTIRATGDATTNQSRLTVGTIRGVGDDPIDPNTSHAEVSASGGNDGTITVPGFTTAGTDRLCVLFAGNTSSISTDWSAEQMGGTAMTEHTDAGALAFCSLAKTEIGATGDFTATYAHASEAAGAFAFAISGAAEAAGGGLTMLVG